MNQQSDLTQKKERVLKTLAIIGFIGLLLAIAWLSVRLVTLAPSAISSLASLADSVYNFDPESTKPVDLIVVANKTIVNNDEPVTISWNEPRPAGTYAFSYECVDGVSLSLRSAGEGIRTLDCGTSYNIGAVNTVDVSINSEKNRFTDVPYTISFIPTGTESPTGTEQISLTVVNASISPVVLVDADEPVDTDTAEPTPTTPETGDVPPSTPTPSYEMQYVYQLPASDPQGYTDLAVTLRGVGVLDSANRFTNSGTLVAGARGAIQFEVKNIGTKTSPTWSYEALLPTGDTYEATQQVALRPNERTVLTIGFTVPDNLRGLQTWNASVTSRTDTDARNNSIVSQVLIQ